VPIKIAHTLPARRILEAEGVAVMSEVDAVRQDIRPLRIGLLNLMPDKVSTETQLARLLGATPLQIELSLIRMTDHVARNTSPDHMAAFYRPWRQVKADRFDGFVITGAPVEQLPFEDVGYWSEFRTILEWTQTHVHRTMTICWAAQAALYHFHGIPKRKLPRKAFGIFPHRSLVPSSPYLRGFSDTFAVPVSRWTEVCSDALQHAAHLQVLAASEESGPCAVDDPLRRTLHMFNHLEYDTGTLDEEYRRDGRSQLPTSYFPADDHSRQPQNTWRSHAHLLFANWIDAIYQTTPFDVAAIGCLTDDQPSSAKGLNAQCRTSPVDLERDKTSSGARDSIAQ
jgi:homoserine O-succinyltransferase/O-acetyltransferase